MESILNVLVSCFRDYNTASKPKEIILLKWLKSDKHAKKVQAIRAGQKGLKPTLPAITPSGVFSYRSESSLISHSGFIQFDIDFKQNTHIANYNELKEQIANIPNVAYCGLSVSGTGYWGLIPIAYPERHRQHFDYVEGCFKQYGIIIDPAPKNVASLRGYSYDPVAHFNHQAEPLSKYEPGKKVQCLIKAADPTSDQNMVEACIDEIVRRGVDITTSYLQDWLPIGSNFAATFGESGRNYFHQVSQFHPGYNQHETNQQYDKCLKNCGGPGDLRTFFARCNVYGIRYKELLGTEPESTELPKPELQKEFYLHTYSELEAALGRARAVEKINYYQDLADQNKSCKSFILHTCPLLMTYRQQHK